MEILPTEEVELPVALVDKPAKKEQVHKLLTPRREIYFISAKIALVLIIAITFLTFGFIVHYRIVPIGKSGVLVAPFLHCKLYHHVSYVTSSSLTALAHHSLPVSTVSVITTVAILIIYVALWPMKNVIDKIRVGPIIYLLLLP